MNVLVEIGTDAAMDETGERGDVRRRLSDKVLAAFTHAYSVGEYEIAKQLKTALACLAKQPGPNRRVRNFFDPVGEAERWISFVDARNLYRSACERDHGDPDQLADALEVMKQAYRRWCGG